MLEPVARRTDFGVDLKTALKLVAIVGAERAFETEGDIGRLGLVRAGREGRAAAEEGGGDHAEGEGAEHDGLVLSHSAGCAEALPPRASGAA